MPTDNIQKLINKISMPIMEKKKLFETERVPEFHKILKEDLKFYRVTVDEMSNIASQLETLSWKILVLEPVYRINKVKRPAPEEKESQTLLTAIAIVQGSHLMGFISSEDSAVTIRTLVSIFYADSDMNEIVSERFVKGKLKTKSRFKVYAELIESLRSRIPKNQNLKSLLGLFVDCNNTLLPEYKISVATLKTEYNAERRKKK